MRVYRLSNYVDARHEGALMPRSNSFYSLVPMNTSDVGLAESRQVINCMGTCRDLRSIVGCRLRTADW